MLLKLKIFLYKLLITQPKIWWMLHFNPVIRAQMKNPKSIPIVIINFNQLFYLKKLVDFLVARNFEKIVIIDNLSTYPPLLDYYKNLPATVIMERMNANYGHMVFFENKELQEKYGKGFYVVTDADIVPNALLPENFMTQMLNILIKEFTKINKVGFALNVTDIPDHYAFKQKVIAWEEQFWIHPYKSNPSSFHAIIDTTFALYKPGYPRKYGNIMFFEGIRIGDKFTATHGGWYHDTSNPTHEQRYYTKTATGVSSWTALQRGDVGSLYKTLYK